MILWVESLCSDVVDTRVGDEDATAGALNVNAEDAALAGGAGEILFAWEG